MEISLLLGLRSGQNIIIGYSFSDTHFNPTVYRRTVDEEGHLAFEPANLTIDDLLQAAEELQHHLADQSAATTPTAADAAAAAEVQEYTPLDLAAVLAAHARRLQMQQEEVQQAEQLRAAERKLQEQQGFPRPSGSGGDAASGNKPALLTGGK